jgi:hypothetical protein
LFSVRPEGRTSKNNTNKTETTKSKQPKNNDKTTAKATTAELILGDRSQFGSTRMQYKE